MEQEKILLTPTQVALAIGCHPEYLKEHEADLGLKSVKTPGGHRRYPLSDVQKLVDRLAIAKNTDVALAKLLVVQKNLK